MKLDYTLTSPEERNELVKKILEETPEPSNGYLEILANYLIFAMEKKERQEKKILTQNRMSTVNKRETSFEGLVSNFANGEDGVYNLIREDKQILFTPKISITEKDLREIPCLRQLRDTIRLWEEKLKRVEGMERFIVKKALIEMRKDQYIIKNAYRKPITTTQIHKSNHFVELDDATEELAETGYPIPEGFTLMDPKICEGILCNYSRLKEDSWDQFEGDTWYIIYDFERTCDEALKDSPLYMRLVECKIDGKTNLEIQAILQEEFGITYTVEYISNLWRKKIPKLIASAAEDQWLNWYYLNIEKGKYKRCSRCGEVKLALGKYFSKNKTSRDGYYSICKKCRNRRTK